MNQNSTIVSRVLTVILILLFTIIQTTVLRGFEVFHVIPNLLLITVVCHGILHGDYMSLAVGVICGFLLDITGGRLVGMNTLLCTLVAYLCICISGNLFNNHLFVAMMFVLLFSIPYELLIYIFYFTIWGTGKLGFVLVCKILPGAVYNFLFTVLLYPLVKRVSGIGQL